MKTMPDRSPTFNPVSASGWAHWIPALGWLRTYQPGWLRGDIVAGITLAAHVDMHAAHRLAEFASELNAINPRA